MFGQSNGIVVTGARTSADAHGLRYELLSADQLRSKFPALNPAPEMMAVWEPRAGALFPELCVAAHLHEAGQYGASLHFNEPVTGWQAGGDGVAVQTTQATYLAKKLVISAGSWVKEFVPELPIIVERQALVWFEPEQPELFAPDRCPIYICEHAPRRYFYGFPDLGCGVKVAIHHEGHSIHP